MKKILKATALAGSGSFALIIAGIIRSKALAVLVGPTGVGLYGLLYSIQNMVASVAGMGLSNSGVREVAAASAAGETRKLAITRTTLVAASAVLGLIGALTMLVFRRQIARMVMGGDTYAFAIALSGVAVWAMTVNGAQTAYLNGLHRLGDQTRISIIGAVSSVAITLLAVWLWRLQGVIIAVVLVPIVPLLTSWWYNSRIQSVAVKVTLQRMQEPLRKMFGLGFVFMTTALMTVGTQLAVRAIITRTLGISATGHFQAAWSISTLYLGFVLNAMGTDYFPRLAAVSADRDAANNMVNEQTEVVLLLSGPVMLGMMTLAPQIIGMLYSPAFHDAVAILRWQVMGDLFKVASWPVAFVLLAQGRTRLFFFAELLWNLIYLLLILFVLKQGGIAVVGFAFFAAYVFYLIVILTIVKRASRFTWSPVNRNLVIILICSTGTVFWVQYHFAAASMLLGIIISVAAFYYSAARIKRALRSDSTIAE